MKTHLDIIPIYNTQSKGLIINHFEYNILYIKWLILG